ncbi:uncharacterized protein LOC143852399 [Tasmannia lanceolata]|uniref:uncharacterized protein LOC143852399 n=1 Tax=Tasmannia lanceolata TaxID=3420 RepID=UPI0040631690
MHAKDHCVALLHMDVRFFRTFVGIFKNTTLLEDTIHCTVEEHVAISLNVIAHNARNLSIRASIRRSGATVSKYFNKDCIGAIDGTHIPAKVSEDIQKRYICRKHFPSQNVLACCDFDLTFTYFLARWEESTLNSRVLASATSKPNGILVLPGKFYLADAGYPCLSHFIIPIRGISYHLNYIRGRRPKNPEELYNQRHSSARNVIERTFVVLKKRFSILNSTTMYSYDKQIDIVLACCCGHNHIRREMPDGSIIQVVDKELASIPAEEEEEEVDGPVPVPPMTRGRGCEMATSAGTKEKKGNVSWNDTMDGVLLAALKNQIAKGQKSGVGGFGWDETFCKVSVKEEAKNEYLKIHPEHLHYFSKRYHEMKAVFDDDFARGEDVRDRRRDPPQQTQDTHGDFSSSLPGPTSVSGGRRSKKRPNAALLSEMQVVSSTGEMHNIPDLKDVVLNIGGFARDELIDAYVYLHGHHKEAEAFLSLDEMDRVEMLGRILRRLAMQL